MTQDADKVLCLVVRYEYHYGDEDESKYVAPEIVAPHDAQLVLLNKDERKFIAAASGSGYALKALEVVSPQTVADVIAAARADAQKRALARIEAAKRAAERKVKKQAAAKEKAEAAERAKFDELRAKFGTA